MHGAECNGPWALLRVGTCCSVAALQPNNRGCGHCAHNKWVFSECLLCPAVPRIGNSIGITRLALARVGYRQLHPVLARLVRGRQTVGTPEQRLVLALVPVQRIRRRVYAHLPKRGSVATLMTGASPWLVPEARACQMHVHRQTNNSYFRLETKTGTTV